MDFAFTDEQLAFRDAVRDLLVAECPPKAVREAWTNDSGLLPDVWAKLAAMGVVGLRAPEAAGGLGLTDLDLVLLLEETGRAALPGPVVEHVAVAVPMLAELGWDDWLGRAVAGDALVTVAVEPWAYVVAGPQADLVLFHQDGRLHTGAEAWDPVVSVDRSRRLAEPRGLSPASHDAPDWAAACDRGALGTAAQLCGVAAHLIDVTVAYACERRQFGAPIGSQQAVKHHLANAALKLDYARPLVYRAAWSLAEHDADRSTHVSMAKAYASDAAALAARVALQVHGAIGYTWEHDLHLWLKRAWVLAGAWGDAAWHRNRVAEAIL